MTLPAVDIPAVFTPDQIAWVNNVIADRDCNPAKPGEPWPEEYSVAQQAGAQFGYDIDTALRLVREAVKALYSDTADAPALVNRRMMIRRLIKIRGLLIREIEKPKGVTTYEMKPVLEEDGKTQKKGKRRNFLFRKVPVKVVVDRRIDASKVKLLLDIETILIDLYRLEEDVKSRGMLERLREDLLKGGTPTMPMPTVTSVTETVRRMELGTVSPRAKQIIAKAVKAEKKNGDGK